MRSQTGTTMLVTLLGALAQHITKDDLMWAVTILAGLATTAQAFYAMFWKKK